MKQIKWFDRKFIYNVDQNIFPGIIERLWGTPIRLQEKISRIPENFLSKRDAGSWTIKENIGHLSDLESLWQGRLEDILNTKEELRPTDLLNTRTTEANHNSRSIDDLIQSFSTVRNNTITMLEALSEEQLFLSALHPRLKTPMRTIDLFLFVADHDDHHLARITELAKVFSR